MVDMLVEQQAEVDVEKVVDTLGNKKAYHCAILWHKG